MLTQDRNSNLHVKSNVNKAYFRIKENSCWYKYVLPKFNISSEMLLLWKPKNNVIWNVLLKCKTLNLIMYLKLFKNKDHQWFFFFILVIKVGFYVHIYIYACISSKEINVNF